MGGDFLQAIRRVDPEADEVLANTPHTYLYQMQVDSQNWVKKEVEGGTFIYKRKGLPKYILLILNKKSTENFRVSVEERFDFEAITNNLMFTKGNGELYNLSFYENSDIDAFVSVLKSIKEDHARKPLSFEETSAAASTSAPKPTPKEEVNEEGANNLLCKLEQAKLKQIQRSAQASTPAPAQGAELKEQPTLQPQPAANPSTPLDGSTLLQNILKFPKPSVAAVSAAPATAATAPASPAPAAQEKLSPVLLFQMIKPTQPPSTAVAPLDAPVTALSPAPTPAPTPARPPAPAPAPASTVVPIIAWSPAPGPAPSAAAEITASEREIGRRLFLRLLEREGFLDTVVLEMKSLGLFP